MPWSARTFAPSPARHGGCKKTRQPPRRLPSPATERARDLQKEAVPYPAPASEGSSRKAKQVHPLCFLARDLNKALKQRRPLYFASGLSARDAITLSSTCADLRKAFEDGRPARPSLWLPPLASLTRVTRQRGGVGLRHRLLRSPEQE